MKSKYQTYHNHRVEPYFTFVKNGQKTIEGRLKKGKYKSINTGDHIVVQNEEETDNVKVLVKEVREYKTFKDMVQNENLQKILPNANSIEEGIDIYRKFYTPEEEKEHGVVAIEVERI